MKSIETHTNTTTIVVAGGGRNSLANQNSRMVAMATGLGKWQNKEGAHQQGREKWQRPQTRRSL